MCRITVKASLTRHSLKLNTDYQGIAGLRCASPAMTQRFRDSIREFFITFDNQKKIVCKKKFIRGTGIFPLMLKL